jgi:penicillin-binding protein 1A
MEPRVPDLSYREPDTASGNGHVDSVDDLFAEPLQPGPSPDIRKRKPKLKKLRLFFVLVGVSALALISTVFGMMISVSSTLPSLENHAQLRVARNSALLAANGKTEIAKLTGAQNRILDEEPEISPNVKNAVIAIEDKRFYEHSGVDFRGIARAVIQDVLRQRAAQGASTITQQFVKNVLAAQGKRTVFQKLREAALAYHLERQWTKDKILTQYLNTVYFGNGAYGIESAARTYFGDGGAQAFDPTAPKAATNLAPWQSAYLAGMIASPSGYDPVQHPVASHARMELVLLRMLQQGMITRQQYDDQKLRYINPNQVTPPRPDSRVPYYSSWVTQQLLDRYRSTGLVFGGGLKVRTSLDPELQAAAEQAIGGRLAGVGPAASLVAIDNKTGEVRAMVGGTDFEKRPFNLATNGHRQPGSSFKPFTLLGALENGVSPDRTFTSAPKSFRVPHSKGERFVVHNYNDAYAGVTTLANATVTSDNSVYAEVGVKLVGTNKIARIAHLMGVRTPLSRNPAMTLGGLREGVTPLEMAYAYSTLANNGERVWGTMGPSSRSPVAIEKVTDPDGKVREQNHVRHTRVIPYNIAQTAKGILARVISGGTGTAAQIGEFAAGKTGTTENYGDAWFVGFNKDLTVAVWVGYPDRLKPMLTEYRGKAVAGGTYPAEIWHDFMTSWIKLRDTRQAARDAKRGVTTPTLTGTSTTPVQTATTTTPTQTGSANTTSTPTKTPAPAPKKTKQPTTPADQQPQTQSAPAQPPAQQPPPAQPQPTSTQPAPTQPPPPNGGGGTGTPPTSTPQTPATG